MQQPLCLAFTQTFLKITPTAKSYTPCSNFQIKNREGKNSVKYMNVFILKQELKDIRVYLNSHSYMYKFGIIN